MTMTTQDFVEIEDKLSVLCISLQFTSSLTLKKYNTAEFAEADLHLIYDHSSVSQPKQLTDRGEIRFVTPKLVQELNSVNQLGKNWNLS